MIHTFIFLLGLMIGILGTNIVTRLRTRSDGKLRIDRSDPDGPYLFLEVSNAIHIPHKKKRVTFDVVDRDFSQK